MKEKKEKTSGNATPESSVLNAGSLTGSVHSTGSVQEETVNNSNVLTNYFSNPAPVVDPSMFFDSFPTNNSNKLDFNTFNTNQFNMSSFGDQNDLNFVNNDDAVAEEDPEIKTNEIYNIVHTEEFDQVPVSDTSNSVLQNEEEHSFSNGYSNMESLKQLSSQIANLVDDNFDFDSPKHTNDLEKRNQELAGLFKKEKLVAEQVGAELNEYKAKVSCLEQDIQNQKEMYQKELSFELGVLQEQLQTHMQTVGILVGEKSELSASLSQCQLLVKQKTCETEDLQVGVKSLKGRVAELEKELNNLKSEKNDRFVVQQNEIFENLRKECQSMREQNEELVQDLSELKEKLNTSVGENLRLQQEIQEVSAHLSLSNVKIQQLSAGDVIRNDSQVESLTRQRLLLEKQAAELNQTVQVITNERDNASTQYQQYAQQLNAQLSSLAEKLESTTKENENLARREQDLVRHVGELERHLQNLQNEHLNYTSSNSKKDLESTVESLESLQVEKGKLEEGFAQIRNERDELLKELLVKKGALEESEATVERLQATQPNNQKLLATMESDKVAAARAVSQNNELKKQLEEMQSVFIKMVSY